jgi:hypothetical protein
MAEFRSCSGAFPQFRDLIFDLRSFVCNIPTLGSRFEKFGIFNIFIQEIHYTQNILTSCIPWRTDEHTGHWTVNTNSYILFPSKTRTNLSIT